MAQSDAPERQLPTEVLERASLRGNEHAWRIADIPLVIDAARRAGLINVGGQLQFRLPDGSTCECYWVQVDVFRDLTDSLPREELVAKTAAKALEQFLSISAQYDFLEEGRRSFKVIKEFEGNGHDLREVMWFVWYAAEAKPDRRSEQTPS
jgi:hypothetical protein